MTNDGIVWREVQRLQAKISSVSFSSSVADNAQLDAVLNGVSDGAVLSRVFRSAQRRERHRNRLIKHNLGYAIHEDTRLATFANHEAAFVARDIWRRSIANLGDLDIQVALSSAFGLNPDEIAQLTGLTNAAARKRLSRLRKSLSAAA